MKKTLLIAALSMAATPALASKARLGALGNAEHLSDVQRIFDRPYEATKHGEFATVEFGSAAGDGAISQTPSADARAEGGFTRQISEGNYLGFYLNREPSALVDTVAGVVDATTLDSAFFDTDGGLNVFYGSRMGDIAWGANLFYLNASKDAEYEGTLTDGTTTYDVSDRKSDVMGLSLGAEMANWEVDAIIGLAGKSSFVSEDAGLAGGGINDGDEVEIESTGNYTLRGAYKMDNMYYFARANMGTAKLNIGGEEAQKADRNEYEIGLINSMRAEGSEFFYGVSYIMNTTKTTPTGGDETKIETNSLPLLVGVEADANSWIVLRGSIRHNLPFLSTVKTTAPGADATTDSAAGNTTIGAGAGFKFNKFTLDTLISASSDGEIGTDGGSFLSNASLTYNF